MFNDLHPRTLRIIPKRINTEIFPVLNTSETEPIISNVNTNRKPMEQPNIYTLYFDREIQYNFVKKKKKPEEILNSVQRVVEFSQIEPRKRTRKLNRNKISRRFAVDFGLAILNALEK